jgi:hypothetical protein
MNQLMNDVQPYVGAIVIAILGALTTMAGVALKVVTSKGVAWIESKTTESQRQTLQLVGQEAFAHAETVYKGMGGDAKLQGAVDYASQHLRDAGINVTSPEIQAAISSAWIDNKAKVNPGALAESTTSSDMKII